MDQEPKALGLDQVICSGWLVQSQLQARPASVKAGQQQPHRGVAPGLKLRVQL